MKIKVNKVGITAVAIAVAVSALGGGYYYATQNSSNQNANTFAATSLYNVQNRDGISLNSSEMTKLNYEYRTATNRSQQTEVQNFNMLYVLDDSGSRTSIIPNSMAGLGSFIDSIDMKKNGVGVISYTGSKMRSLTESNLGAEILKKMNIDTLKYTDYMERELTLGDTLQEGVYFFPTDSAKSHLPVTFAGIDGSLAAGRQKVLIFESDFQDFGAPQGSHEGFMNGPTVAELKKLGYKVVLIGDEFSERTLTPIEKDFSYKISSTKADGSFLDRGDILRMFVQTTVKETTTSPNTAYELSLSGTSYKFSPNFLAEMRKNSNFVVEGEDFIRLKVPEFNAQLNSANKPSPVSVAFSGVDVVYRSNSTQPQAVEYLSVKKDAASDRIAINFTAPVAQEQTIYVNDEIKAEDSISNVAQLPNGATYKFKEKVDVSIKGKKEATVMVTYGDGMVVEVPVIINVLPKSNVTVKYLDTDGKELKPEVKLLEQQKEGTDYKAEQLDIEGYKFLKLDEKSAQAEGKLGEEDLEVIFIYEKVIVAPNTGHHKHETAEINFTSILSVLASLTLAVVIFAKTKFRKVKF